MVELEAERRPPSLRGRRLAKINKLSAALLVEAMLDGAMTVAELAKHTGLRVATVSEYATALRKAKAAHVCGWAPNALGQYVMPLYRIGRGRDVAKPAAMTATERSARYRQRQRSLRVQRMVEGRHE